jgi:CDGSH-type Zn-finger protein
MSEPVIRVRENGPYVIEMPVRVVDHQGNEFPVPAGKPVVALCRCGQSANRPFCDGTHKKVQFQAPELAPANPATGTPPQP